ncbi:hypothetical protein Sste5344_004434 [Sporothrix stenoceras]
MAATNRSFTVKAEADSTQHDHVVVKVFARTADLGLQQNTEISVYQKIKTVLDASSHPGRNAIRTVLDHFYLTGPAGEHQCLVHPPLWESARNVLYMNPIRRFPPMMMAMLLRQVFLALDFLHTECHLIHTDIKADNLVYNLDASDPVLIQFEEDEMRNPSPCKKTQDGHIICMSRHIAMPESLGYPVLCDFGSAMPGDTRNTSDAQPDAYRSPEMILQTPWSYPIDIWNVGCMVWDLCQGGHLFSYDDPEDHMYRSSVHLASIMSLLGPVPPNMVQDCTVKSKFFNDKARSWDSVETKWKDEGKDRELFLKFMQKMIEWDPKKRATAAELVHDDWIKAHRSDKKSY